MIKRRIYEILFCVEDTDSVGRAFNIGMLALISLNVLAVIFETEKGIFNRFEQFFILFDIVSVGIFTIEYLLRLWTCTLDSHFSHPVFGRIRYVLQPIAIIDLLAFLPFYIPTTSLDLRFIRAIRLFRLFRLFKMGHYSRSLQTLGNVIKSKKEELGITLFAGLILLIIAGSLMYIIESKVQPEAFSSIPASMWWGVATLTTVGYGDIYPKTVLGKLIGSFIAVLGIGLFALPAGIIASGFASQLDKKNSRQSICPHCGKVIDN